MKSKKLLVFGVILLVYSLTSFNGLVGADQHGSLPTGEFWLDDSYIKQTDGDYSFFYELNEHTIGEDNSKYNHNFRATLELNISDCIAFWISFEFSTPFETLLGGSPGLILQGSPPQPLNFTLPLTSSSFAEEAIFEYAFSPINTTSYSGGIIIDLEISTTDELYEVRGTETFGIELSNGTRYFEQVIIFQMIQIEYSTTEGPDNVFIPVDQFTVFITLLFLPVIKKIIK